MTDPTDKLVALCARCKCSITIQCNPHKDVYESVGDHLLKDALGYIDELNIPADVMYIMKETDTMICIQFYPDTPVGFYRVYHYDINMALDLALEALK